MEVKFKVSGIKTKSNDEWTMKITVIHIYSVFRFTYSVDFMNHLGTHLIP